MMKYVERFFTHYNYFLTLIFQNTLCLKHYTVEMFLYFHKFHLCCKLKSYDDGVNYRSARFANMGSYLMRALFTAKFDLSNIFSFNKVFHVDEHY